MCTYNKETERQGDKKSKEDRELGDRETGRQRYRETKSQRE